VKSADTIAGEAAKAYPIVTRNQAMHDYIELRKLSANEDGTVNEDAIRKNVGVMAKARAAAAATGIEITEQDALNLAIAVEGSGRAGDPRAQEMMVDAYLRAKKVLGSAIDTAKVRDYVANAKSANFPMDDEAFYYTTFARLGQGNAARLGNEASSTFNTLVGGHMTKAGAQTLARWGLIDQNQIVDGKGGKFYIRGDIKDKDLLSSDPTKWSQERLLKGIEASGALSDDKVKARVDSMRARALKANPNAQIDEHALKEKAYHGLLADEISKAGFKTTVADNLVHAIANELLIRKDVAQMKTATGIEGANTINRNPVAAFQELTNSISNFGIVMANPVMRTVAQVLDAIAHGVSSLSTAVEEFQKNHPDLGKVVAGAVPAGAVVGGGALAWGILDGLLSGFGLKGSAAALTGSAEALTVAAARLGGAPVPGTGTPGKTATAAGGAAAAAAEGGAMYTLGRWAGKGLGLLKGAIPPALTGLALEMFDPGGNLWGFTKPVDDWAKRKFGFDPSKPVDPLAALWSWYTSKLPYDDKTVGQNKGTMRDHIGTSPGYTPNFGTPPGASNIGNMPSLPKIDTTGTSTALGPVKVDTTVKGEVTGEASLHQILDINTSPLLDARLKNLEARTTLPMRGKLGDTMTGSNGTRLPGNVGRGDL
jgi:hypothetical protein